MLKHIVCDCDAKMTTFRHAETRRVITEHSKKEAYDQIDFKHCCHFIRSPRTMNLLIAVAVVLSLVCRLFEEWRRSNELLCPGDEARST